MEVDEEETQVNISTFSSFLIFYIENGDKKLLVVL